MMKSKISILFLMAILFALPLFSQSGIQLNPADYAAKIKQLPNAPVVDVRTPNEFAQGHLVNAINVNLNSADFQQQIGKLDKSKPVFVYCLSGGRSSSAMSTMLSIGFKEVYNLAGGMMKWRMANLPETTAATVSVSKGMTMAQYQALLQSNKLVLIDFYAVWCAPCQKMKPYLEEISNEMKTKVEVVRIDADANKLLVNSLKVDALPTLLLYKNGKQIWSYTGYLSKEEVVKQLK